MHDIWATEDQHRRFAETRLGPAVRATIGDGAGRPQPEVYEIANVVDAGLAEAMPSHNVGVGALLGK